MFYSAAGRLLAGEASARRLSARRGHKAALPARQAFFSRRPPAPFPGSGRRDPLQWWQKETLPPPLMKGADASRSRAKAPPLRPFANTGAIRAPPAAASQPPPSSSGGIPMKCHYNFGDYDLPPKNVHMQHMPVALLLDLSGSMNVPDGRPIRNLNLAANKFIEEVARDPAASGLVDVAVIGFNDEATVIQGFRPVTEIQPLDLTAGGGTNLSAALELAVQSSASAAITTPTTSDRDQDAVHHPGHGRLRRRRHRDRPRHQAAHRRQEDAAVGPRGGGATTKRPSRS